MLTEFLGAPFVESMWRCRPGTERECLRALLAVIDGSFAGNRIVDVCFLERDRDRWTDWDESVDALLDSDRVLDRVQIDVKGVALATDRRARVVLEGDAVGVLCNGSEFCFPMGFKPPKRMFTVGLAIARFFVAASRAMPSVLYGAILIENPLPPPAELAEEGCIDSSFWVPAALLHGNAREELLGMMHAAYCEEHPEGLYFSTYAPFNERRVDVSGASRVSAGRYAARLALRSLA